MTRKEKDASDPSLPGRFAGAFVDAFLVFLVLTYASRFLSLPYREGAIEVVSAVSRARFEPFTNYLRFLLIFAGTLFAFSFTYLRGASLLHPLVSIGKRFSLACGIAVGKWVLWFVLMVLIGIMAVNRTATDMSAPLEDTFHEGEYVGNVPAIQLGNPFERIFLIHGGMDILPGWLANRFSPTDRRVTYMRLVTVALHGFAFLTALLVLFLSARPQISGRSGLEAAFLALASFLAISALLGYDAHSLALPVAGGQQPLSVRDALFLVQLGLLFGFFLLAREGRSWPVLSAVSIALGLILPLSFLYSYERAICSAIVVLVLTPALLTQSRTVSVSWLSGLALGGCIGLACLLQAVGQAGVREILDQIYYWGRTSRYISTTPFIPANFSVQMFLLLALAVLLQCGGMVFLFTEYRRIGSIREVVGRHFWILAWLVVSFAFLRVALERPDSNHILTGVMPSCLFLGALLVICLDRAVGSMGIPLVGSSESRGRWISWCFVVLFLLPFVGSPIKALRTFRSYSKAVGIPDTRIVKGDYLAAASTLKGEVLSSGSFFTMTSEGVWYYLFGVPSCSRFHHLFYARDPATQRELVDSIKTRKPSVILFSNSSWSNKIDGLSVFNSNAPVARYILTSYEPYRIIKGHWFWRYAGRAKSFDSRPVGTVDTIPARVKRTQDAVFSGTLFPMSSGDEVEAIFTSIGTDNVLVWAGRDTGESGAAKRWNATLPTAALPSGPATVRFWLLPRSRGGLHILGGPIHVSIE